MYVHPPVQCFAVCHREPALGRALDLIPRGLLQPCSSMIVYMNSFYLNNGNEV